MATRLVFSVSFLLVLLGTIFGIVQKVEALEEWQHSFYHLSDEDANNSNLSSIDASTDFCRSKYYEMYVDSTDVFATLAAGRTNIYLDSTNQQCIYESDR